MNTEITIIVNTLAKMVASLRNDVDDDCYSNLLQDIDNMKQELLDLEKPKVCGSCNSTNIRPSGMVDGDIICNSCGCRTRL